MTFVAALQFAGCSPQDTTRVEATSPHPPSVKSTATERNVSNTSREDLIKIIGGLQVAANQKLTTKPAVEAYDLFRQSGTLAQEFVEHYPDLAPRERSVCSTALYNLSCALAKSGDAAAGLVALDQAISAGWGDLGHLDSDVDLESVRQLPEFSDRRRRWGEIACENTRDQITHQIANQLSAFRRYDFDFTLPDLNSQPVKLSDFRGKVVVVDIWGTWCPPCRAEIPSFVQLQERYGEQGLQVLGVNYELSEQQERAITLIRGFRESVPMNYPCLIGDPTTKAKVRSFRSFPTTLFLDRTGQVRWQLVGAQPYSRLEAVTLALLSEE